MFEILADRVQRVINRVTSKGVLTRGDVENVLREIRIALLEADVNIEVVKGFIDDLKKELVGQKVIEGLTPVQHIVKVVYDKMVELLGGEFVPLNLSVTPSVIMLVGLQGSGKTTTAAKLANYVKSKGKRPVLVAADVYRAAAVDQLKKLAEDIGAGFYHKDASPVEIAYSAVDYAKDKGFDTVILDTAGRLHIDDIMMQELERIKFEVSPGEILLVVDAMTGQEAASVAKSFNDRIGITGVILTKMDGDARGGAALTVKKITGKPIKFVGVGEKLDALEEFHPDRVASRILGMGDVLTLIEKAQKAIDEKKAKELEKKFYGGDFTLEDMREQLVALRKMGSIDTILDMLPGIGGIGNLKKMLKNVRIDEKEIIHMEAIINSMTPEERRRPSIINSSRKRRIAKGSGTSVQMVNRLLKQYEQMRKMMKGMKKKKKKKFTGLPFGDIGSDIFNLFR